MVWKGIDVNTKSKRWIGRWLIVSAVLHTLYALVVFNAPLMEIVQAGLFDAINRDPVRSRAVWFVFFGFCAALAGIAADALENARIDLPRPFGIGLLLIAILGVVLMPRSGLWLLFPPALAAILGAVNS